MQLAKEAWVKHLNPQLLCISSMIHFKFSFSIHLSPGVLSFISRSNFFFIELCVTGTSEKIKFHPLKLFAASKSIIQCYFYTESPVLPSRAVFRFLTCYYCFGSCIKPIFQGLAMCGHINSYNSILRSLSLLLLNGKNIMLVISLNISAQ